MTEDYYNDILRGITPRYAGAVFGAAGCPVPLTGESIKKHIGGCRRVLISCATLGEEFDRLLRQTQITDMAGAVILDKLGGGYIQDFCDKKDRETIFEIAGVVTNSFRFAPGYGDYPLNVNREILDVLGAGKKIGLCVTETFLMTPIKSVAGVTPFEIQ